MSLSDRVKTWFTWVNPLFLKFCRKGIPLIILASETFNGKLRPNG